LSGCPAVSGDASSTCALSPEFVSQPVSPISSEAALDGFNFTPSSGSPVVGKGVSIPGLTLDYNGTTRPSPPSIGAIE